MTLLAIDCATDACSAALWTGGEPGPHRFRRLRRGHAEILMPMVAAIMTEAELQFTELDAVAVTTGPGAFTGIRIGLAAARGIALAAALPVIGVTTLEAVAAAHAGGDAHLLVALESKREDIYVQLFAPDGAPLTAPASAIPDAIHELIPDGVMLALAGDAADRLGTALADRAPPVRRLGAPELPDAAVVARLAAQRFAVSPPGPCDPPPSALYLRPPDATPVSGHRSAPGP